MRRSTVSEGSAVARWLRSRYGQRPIRAIAQDIASEFLTAAKETRPPIDPASILALRRVRPYRLVTGARAELMTKDGRLSVAQDGFRLEVRAGPKTRTRFTLAHELGHTIFYDLDSSPPRRMLHGEAPRDEESFCNLVASEILMPADMVGPHIQKHHPKDIGASPITTIVGLAEVFKVSAGAMARRLVEDLEVLDGIALGCRWLPKVASSNNSTPLGWAWRLSWWAASPAVIGPLYLPAASRRPRVGLMALEEAYLHRAGLGVEIDLKSISLGNLRKILSEEAGERATAHVWVHPILPSGIQLRSRSSEGQAPEDPAVLVRQASEVIAFFPLGVYRSAVAPEPGRPLE